MKLIGSNESQHPEFVFWMFWLIHMKSNLFHRNIYLYALPFHLWQSVTMVICYIPDCVYSNMDCYVCINDWGNLCHYSGYNSVSLTWDYTGPKTWKSHISCRLLSSSHSYVDFWSKFLTVELFCTLAINIVFYKYTVSLETTCSLRF